MIDTQINTLVRIIADMRDPSDGTQLPDDTIALIAQGLKLLELVEKRITQINRVLVEDNILNITKHKLKLEKYGLLEILEESRK